MIDCDRSSKKSWMSQFYTLMMYQTLAPYRQQFPALSNKAYFNYGGQGPLPDVALNAIQASYAQVQKAGPFSAAVNRWITSEANETRAAIASELGVTPETISLTEDVSVGCNIPLWGLDWQPGDHLVISDCEHQGIVAAVGELQRRFQLEVSICRLAETLNAGDPVVAIAQELRPNTRLVVLSHILWNTGQVLPLTEIVQLCHNHRTQDQPIRVLVDAAQSVGVLPLNLSEIEPDFYAFTGHKWWCGPEGVGALYVHPNTLESISPTLIGWRNINMDQTGKPLGWKPDGRRFEIATSAFPLYAGLRAAIALHHEWATPTERYEQICQKSRYLWEGLMKLEGVHCLKATPPEAGLVSFQLTTNQSHQQLVEFLEQHNIFIRTILSLNCVRACVHYLTLESEIDQLIEGVQKFIVQ